MNRKAIIYPIGGGKGGVGKSFITANLGVLLAKQGKKVLLIDLDLGGPNLHTFFGAEALKTGLNYFLSRNAKELDQVVVPTNFENLYIISSKGTSLEAANMPHAQKIKLIRAIKKLDYDYILLDLGAGTNFNTLDFFLTSNEGIFVCTPQPTSIENTFLFIKTIFYRKVKQVLKLDTFREIISSLSYVSDDNHIKLQELIEFAAGYDPHKGKQLKTILEGFRFYFIMNEYSRQVDPKLGKKIERVYNTHFPARFIFLGNVDFDEKVYDSILSKKMFMKKYPYTSTATDLRNLVRSLTININESDLESRNVS
ncbi:MAG: P-loop NTPase [Desulfobacteraceae bacterium]|jgi:flagellar biosynthesis protein FlhG